MPIVEAVGISCNSTNADNRPLAAEIQRAMSGAVLLAAEQGITDPVKVHELMQQARATVKLRAAGRPKPLRVGDVWTSR